MRNFLKSFGPFKGFFFIVLPACFLFFCAVSAVGGNLDLNGYLIVFGWVYAAVLLNHYTK